jgi:hypothetical protein
MSTACQHAHGAVEPCLLATEEGYLAYRLLYNLQRFTGTWVRYAVMPYVIDERSVGFEILATDVQLYSPPMRHQVNKVMLQRGSSPVVESLIHGRLAQGGLDIHVGEDEVRSLALRGGMLLHTWLWHNEKLRIRIVI